ncbi:MAG TPA: hypothetical protein VFI47_09615 [Acidimicrobiales bacterium]|nr:hypothetical protein [Acidimicrobiales bacterium]
MSRRPRRLGAGARSLTVVALVVVLLAACSDDGGGDGADGGGSPEAGMTTTTVNTGGVVVDAPDGWQAIPLADLHFGLAVPPGWEALVLSPEGLATLAGASPSVPGFSDLAHAAAAGGSIFYAAGQDAAGGISDVDVRATPQAGIADLDGLRGAAAAVAAGAQADPAAIEVVEGTDHPTVLVPFTVGAGDPAGGSSAATAIMVAGPDDILWEVTVASDDAATHGELTRQIAASLTFVPS